MIEEIIFLLLGLAGLWLGADFLVKGAKNIAGHLGVSPFFIGLAIVSIGTSIPEIAVSVTGGLDRLAGFEASGIVVGNIIGSALNQIGLILGILAFLLPLRLKREVILKQGSFLLASVLLVFGLGVDGVLSRTDGIIAIAAYLAYYIFLWYNYPIRKPGRRITRHLVKDSVYAFIGIALVAYTSNIVVQNGVELANIFGVSQSLIGILLIGLGTGLPEFSVAIASIRRNSIKISLGNLIGSNISDLLLALGAGTVISGFVVDRINLVFDLPVLLIFTLLVLWFFYTGRRISKREGAILIGLFLVYALLKVFVTG